MNRPPDTTRHGATRGMSASAPGLATHAPAGVRPVVDGAGSRDSDLDALALPVGTRLAEFELTRAIGAGGFSIVYLAWDHSLQRQVALKEYMPVSISARVDVTRVSVRSSRHRDTFEAGLRSFINEARLLARFDHPSLVKVYRFWEANGTAYMVMPFYEGRTLRDRLPTLASPPDEAWLLGLLGPMTEALQVIHREQCYHRDVAPDNILLLADSGLPLLLDFGAARQVIGDMTQALTVILKPGYAPVEQYAELPHMKQGGWTDVYALAAVVHWVITGSTPPPSVGRMLSDTYKPLVERAKGRFSAGFLQAIDRALLVLPDQRTQNIADFRRDLGLAAEVVVVRSPLAGATLRRPEGSTHPRGASSADATLLSAHPAPILAWADPEATRVRTSAPTSQPDEAATARAPPALPVAPGRPEPIAPIAPVAPVARADARESAGRPAATAPARPRPVAPVRSRWLVPVASMVVLGAAAAYWASGALRPGLARPDRPVAEQGGVAGSPVAAPVLQAPSAATPTPPLLAKPLSPPLDHAPAQGQGQARATESGTPAVATESATVRPAQPAEVVPVTVTTRDAPPVPAPSSTRSNPPSRPPPRETAQRAECATLMQRLSLGDSDPSLLARLHALGCR